MTTGRAGLLHLALASLVLSSVPQFSYGEEKTLGNVGCLFSDRLCDDEEICFNDLVFGRCISTSSEQEDLTRFPWLSTTELGLLEVEMSRVLGLGYSWSHPYAQCVFQTILHCIANSHEYSMETCQHLREAQLELQGENNQDNDYEVDGFPGYNFYPGSPSIPQPQDIDQIPQNTGMYKFIPQVEGVDSYDSSSIPISYEDPYPISNYPSLNYLQAYPDDQDSPSNYPLESSPDYPQDYSPIFSRDTRSANDPPSLDYPDISSTYQDLQDLPPSASNLNELPILVSNFPQESPPPQTLYEDDTSSKLFVPELNNYKPPFQQFWDDVDIVRHNPKLVEQIRQHPEFLEKIPQNSQLEYLDSPPFFGNVPENFDDLILPNDDHEQTDEQSDDQDEEPVDEDYEQIQVEDEPTFRQRRNDEEAFAPEPATLMDAIYHDEITARKQAPDYDFEYDSDENDDETPLYYNVENEPIPIETVFSRNERLDVKKPGPFFENSQNNFYLDKLKVGTDEDNETSDNNGDYADNVPIVDGLTGQTEYEMPLSPPGPRRKKDIFNEKQVGFFNSEPQTHKYYLFININDRFNTLSQGKKMIELIADYLKIPHQAFSEPILENSKLAVEVLSNPRQLNATFMADLLDGSQDLKEEIKKRTNLEVDTITAGDENSDVGVVLAPSDTNRLVMLVFLLAAALTTLLIIAAVLLVIRRRKRKDIAVDDVITDIAVAKEEPVAEYKQLCRDWSRSSRASQGSTSGGKEGKDNTALKEGKEGKEEPGKEINAAARPTASPSRAKLPNKARENSEGSRTSSTSSWNEEPGVSSMDISTGHMVLAYMEDHLKNKQRLEQEWVGLCAYEAEPSATSIAFKVENKKKNRYPDKLPYDHNRVMLNPLTNGSSSDYINASTVMDHDPRNPAYIVTQGPLAHTVADFWQMVWEQGSVVIVMLTKLQENGYQLAHRYWPEEGSEQYHIFEVHLVSEHVWCDDYLVRSVYLRNTQTGETRTVTQFHFLSWPDTGVPTSTKAILEFRRKVNKSYRGRSCPIIIHCSDGVGRSGTYVLIDMVLNRMTKGSKEIDIAATLEHIRDQRSGMVKSRSQFEFCLMAVAEETHAILKALPQ